MSNRDRVAIRVADSNRVPKGSKYFYSAINNDWRCKDENGKVIGIVDEKIVDSCTTLFKWEKEK